MKRFKHSLSHYVLSTFNMGQLIPVGHYAVLPGDSVRHQTSLLMRLSPLVTPVMHPVSVRLHTWFVPYRLLWDEWEQFITGGEDGEGDGYTYPQFSTTFTAGQLPDYLGIPPGVNVTGSRLPLRAYYKIWNENYRDQDLQASLGLDDSADIQNICWEKDLFTAARPWTQKGPNVTLPLGTSAPVVPSGTGTPSFTVAGTARDLQVNTATAVNITGAAPPGIDTLDWNDPHLEADLSAATSVDVNQVRLAMALQRWAEARAQFGSRYTEYLRYLGVRSSDARLQRPEYLGGGRATISFSEVLNTGGTDDGNDVAQGSMAGHGISAMRTRPFVRFFEEHGIVMTLASVRPRSIYASGLDREWSKTTKEDYWQRELERIGQQEVYNREIYAGHTTPNGVFGYQDRYSEYRSRPSYVCGQFRSTLDDWHLARIFTSDPALNDTFVECNPTNRCFADQTAGAQLLWTMASHSVQARRMVGNKVIGRIM